mgnify:FL=1
MKEEMTSAKPQPLSTRPRILCLHGMRTSGLVCHKLCAIICSLTSVRFLILILFLSTCFYSLILSRQMASLKYHVEADFVFINGPFEATGPPQQVITQYYPNLPYYEWQSENSGEGLKWLLEYLTNEENGSFDGILGFSQVSGYMFIHAFL